MPKEDFRDRSAIEQGLQAPQGRRVRRRFHPERRRAVRRSILWALRISDLLARGYENAVRPIVRHIHLSLPTLPTAFSGLRILHLSDLHAEMPVPLLEQVIDSLRGIPVDLCLLTGDYRFGLSGSSQPACEAVAHLLAATRPPLGTFGVLGNHDSTDMVARLEQVGATILVNRAVAIPAGRERLYLLGVDDPHYYGCDDLPRALAGVPAENFKILLAHSPELFEEAGAAQVDLYLCGHTHAGQVCFPWVGPLWLNARCPRQFTRGAWTYRNMHGFTSAGLGCSMVWARFNCPPEITVITLTRVP